MDYAFCRVTKHKLDEEYTALDIMWLPLEKIVSFSPVENGTLVTHFDGSNPIEVVVRETPEGIFNSVVFVKSPSTYYVDPQNPSMPDMDQ